MKITLEMLQAAGVSVETLASGSYRLYGVDGETIVLSDLRMLTPTDYNNLIGNSRASLGGTGRQRNSIW